MDDGGHTQTTGYLRPTSGWVPFDGLPEWPNSYAVMVITNPR